MFDQCDLAWFDPAAAELYYDLAVLQMLEAESAAAQPDLEGAWGGELLHELNRVANLLDPADRATWPPAQEIARTLYQRHNASCVHELSAIGHAHIDTAWLWPLAETYRKCVRSFSSQASYMERYPEFRFACSRRSNTPGPGTQSGPLRTDTSPGYLGTMGAGRRHLGRAGLQLAQR